MNDFSSFYEQFVQQLSNAKANNTPREFQLLLNVVEPDWRENEKELYVDYCIKKAGIFALFGETLDMDAWMQKALQFGSKQEQTSIYFQWADLYWSLCKSVDNQPQLTAMFSGLFNVSTRALKLKHGLYDTLAFQSLRAFSLAAFGKHSEVEQYLSGLSWKPVPARLLNNKNALTRFYMHIYKMLVAALEIRSAHLMTQILHMITMDDALMLSAVPLYKKFNTVVIDIADMRPEFAVDFNTFYQLRKKWAGFLPNFGLFTMAIEEENTKGLNLFFSAMN